MKYVVVFVTIIVLALLVGAVYYAQRRKGKFYPVVVLAFNALSIITLIFGVLFSLALMFHYGAILGENGGLLYLHGDRMIAGMMLLLFSFLFYFGCQVLVYIALNVSRKTGFNENEES